MHLGNHKTDKNNITLDNINNSNSIDCFQLTIIAISAMIGAGILTLPNILMKYGIYGTLGWIVASVMSLIIGTSFGIVSTNCEGDDMASIIKHSPVFGSYGSLLGKMCSIMVWMCLVTSSSGIVLTFAKYCLGDFQHKTFAFGVCCTVIFASNLAHFIGQSFAQKIIKYMTLAKASLFSIIAVFGIVSFNKENVFKVPNLNYSYSTQKMPSTNEARIKDQQGASEIIDSDIKDDAQPTKKMSPVNMIITSAGFAFFAFLGMESTITMANETINPKFDVPIAIGASIIISSLIFILCHLASVNVLGLNPENNQTPVHASAELTMRSILENKLSFMMPIIKPVFEFFGCSNVGPQMVGAAFGNLVTFLAIVGCMGSMIAMVMMLGKLLMKALTGHTVKGFQMSTSLISSAVILCICAFNIFLGQDLSTIIIIACMLMLFAYKLLAISGLHLKSFIHKALCFLSFILSMLLNIACIKKLVGSIS